MSGFWVVRGGAIKDETALTEYAGLWAPIAERYGAEVIAGRGTVDTREGPHFPRQLVIQFPSYQDAVACYEDAQYKIAMEVANRAYDRELVILEG
ncbi:MAG: DUF1330 domain-containing protein [Gammaproteobacteria bacterium]|nr:DUF1330 domain-containing protein [Gammaproteobacteria bacterium]